jgi:hypothetical protein
VFVESHIHTHTHTHIYIYIYVCVCVYILGGVCRTVAAIGYYEGPSKKSKSVEARYPDILLLDLRSAITTSR